MRLWATGCVVALAVIAAVPASAAPARWSVGVGYGAARGGIDASREVGSGALEGVAQSIRIGRLVTPALRVGYDHQAWLYEQGVRELKARAGVQLEALGVAARPFRSGAWDGLRVGAGVGWAHCRLTLLEPFAPGESAIGETYETVFKQDEFGWGWYGAVGYEIPVTRSFAASLSMSYNAVEIQGAIFDRAWFAPLMAGLDWRF